MPKTVKWFEFSSGPRSVGPDLVPNCLQNLSGVKSHHLETKGLSDTLRVFAIQRLIVKIMIKYSFFLQQLMT